MLRQIDEGLYCVEGELWMPGRVYFQTRTTIVVLEDGTLWIHSPIASSEALFEEVEALGEVSAIVAPSCWHHLYVSEWVARFPNARLYAAPGLREKRPDLDVDEVLGDNAPAQWEGAIDQVVMQGTPKINEVFFVHRATRSLILTDLVFNIHEWKGWMTTLVYTMAGVKRQLAQSRLWRSVTKDRAAAGESLRRMLQLDFERVIMCHGELVEDDGRAKLEGALWWMLGA